MARRHDLDALRCFCMLYGIFYHAHAIAETGVSAAIFGASGFFRMATFFFVSAFFTALLLERRGLRGTLSSRAIALGVPLVVTFLTLVPLAKWGLHSLAVLPEPPVEFWPLYLRAISFDLSGFYMHLWFLVVLLVYLPTAPILAAALRHRAVHAALDAIAAALPARLHLVALALAVGAASALTLLAAGAVLPGRALGSLLVVGCIFNYPFYVMGLAAYIHRERFDGLVRLDPLAIALGLAAASYVLSVGMNERLPSIWFAAAAANTVAALTLSALFARIFTRPGPRLAFLSRSIYSVYLVHFTLLALYGLAFARMGLDGAPLYWLTIAATLPSAFLFHDLVERLPLLTFLYNGRLPARRAPPVAGSVEGGLAR